MSVQRERVWLEKKRSFSCVYTRHHSHVRPASSIKQVTIFRLDSHSQPVHRRSAYRMSGNNNADQTWAQQDKRRVLVLDVRVQNIEHAQQFYEQHLGMKLWRRLGDLQQGQFTSICGYGQSLPILHSQEHQ